MACWYLLVRGWRWITESWKTQPQSDKLEDDSSTAPPATAQVQAATDGACTIILPGAVGDGMEMMPTEGFPSAYGFNGYESDDWVAEQYL